MKPELPANPGSVRLTDVPIIGSARDVHPLGGPNWFSNHTNRYLKRNRDFFSILRSMYDLCNSMYSARR